MKLSLTLKKQFGMGLIGLMVVLSALGFAGFIVMKSVSPWIEYGKAKKALSSTASGMDLMTATDQSIKTDFDKRRYLDGVTSINQNDLTITRQQGRVILSFKYEKLVPLFPRTGLLFQFDASTGP